MSYFTFYKTNSEGEKVEESRNYSYKDVKRCLALQYPGKLAQLQHFIDLAHAAPRHPVDVAAFDPRNGALVFSGRLEYIPEVYASDSPKIEATERPQRAQL